MPDTTPLSMSAADFLSTLEGNDYPQALALSFPHIVNAIVELRSNPLELRAYFETLTRDIRGGRKGFPLDVLLNIQDLKDRLIGPETDGEGALKWF